MATATQGLLAGALLALAACSCETSDDPTTVSVTVSLSPPRPRVGEEVTLSVSLTSAVGTDVDVTYVLSNPSGVEARARTFSAVAIAANAPSVVREVLTDVTGTPGHHTLSLRVRRGQRIAFEAADAASFFVESPDAIDGGHGGGSGGGGGAGGGGGNGGGGSADGGSDAGGSGGGQPPGHWLSGAGGDHIADGTFGTWRGAPVDIAGTWSDDSAENQAEVWSIRSGFEYGKWTRPIDIAVGGIFGDETWAKAASGDLDGRFRASLTTIRDARQGRGTTYIRFAHEFNGDWYWPVTPSNVADFKKAWVRFAALKEEIFPEAKLVWCPNDGTTGTLKLDVRDAYPGSDFVDVIAVDSYNWDPAANSQAEFDRKIQMTDGFGAPVGIEQWRKFAELKGRPFAIAEWSGNAPQGDNPEYMSAFHTWLVAHGGSGPGQVLYEILFNTWDDFRLYPNSHQPDAAARYKQEW
jgi:hypothetical protein